MAEVSKCTTTDCINNEEGKCKLEEISLNDFYECEQCVQEDDE